MLKKKETCYHFETAVTNDFNTNVSGGIKQGFSFLGNIDLILSFDTEKAKLWKGGQFFFYGLANYGNPLSEYVGGLQTSNNIEADNNVRLYQFWYRQIFNKFEIIIGQHDLNSEFASTDYASLFINSSFGIQPDISINNAISIFPVATLGIITKWKTSNFSILAALYNGNPGSEEENPNSLNWVLSKKNGLMSIFEIQYTYKKEATIKGTYKLGMVS
jgi:porin